MAGAGLLGRKSFPDVAARAVAGADLEIGVPGMRPPLVERRAQIPHAILRARKSMGAPCRS